MKAGFRPPATDKSKSTKALSPVVNKNKLMFDVIDERPTSSRNAITAQDLKKGKPLSLAGKRDAFLYAHAEVLYLIENKNKKANKRVEHSKIDQAQKVIIIYFISIKFSLTNYYV